ncbi:putative membrane-bound dehydrogenase-like protein [Pedobacter sp. UYP24]
MRKYLAIIVIIFAAAINFKGSFVIDNKPRRLEILLLGHKSEHHNSEKFAEIVSQDFFKNGINISYTTDPNDLNAGNLAKYDGLIIYANHDTITAPQEKALLDYVKSGKAFIPVHCASFCFQNSPEYINMVGGQFKEHKTDTFIETIVDAKHPIMKGLTPFTTWDETYVHTKLAKDIHVLTERVEGTHHEAYTWVKNYGKGKVFYTAYGHDERTWKNPGFLKLLQNGLLWAVNDAAKKEWEKLDKPTASYSDAKLPNYEKREGGFQLQAPLSPKESQLLIQVPVDFKMQLFAAEPDIEKPIAMAWDERGRLWIVETIDYPNTVRDVKGEGLDRIKICEDTNGDGKADKFTVFADKLNIPTSIVFANGGVIIAQAPDFIFLKDTDGDDKADIREKIITGWGTFDTHAGPSNLKYGMDNKIWGTVGYSGYNGKVGDQDVKFSQGVYHFDLNGKNLEYLGGTSNNTWGLGFSENNDVFLSTANNTHSAFLGIPSTYLAKINEPANKSIDKIDGHYAMHVVTKNLRQVDVFNGFTAAAGHNLYTARNFPKAYWNRIAFVNEPTGRVVHQAILEPNGSGFTEQDGWNLVASADEWFGPVQTDVGPDGAVWVLDWYNFIIQHNPTPQGFENGKGNAYINPLRDRTHGRIYKIVYNNATTAKIKSLDKKDAKSLLGGLQSDNMFWRTTAQRLIVESGNKAIAPELYKLIRDKKVDELGINPAAIHSLWTLQGLGMYADPEAFGVAVEALSHPSAGVRKAALQVLPNNSASLAAINKAGLLNDANLNTRLAAILKISELPPSPALTDELMAAEKNTQNSNDRWIKEALKIAIVRHVKPAVINDKAAATKSEESKTLKTVKQDTKPDQTIRITPIVNAMKFATKTFIVKAGSTVEIVFDNIDFMQHNFLILQKGSMEKVGAAADKLAQDPKGADKQYVPIMPEVLFHTPLVNPEESFKLRFKVPASVGDYPFICSFPGHWRIMNGVMKVIK